MEQFEITTIEILRENFRLALCLRRKLWVQETISIFGTVSKFFIENWLKRYIFKTSNNS